MRNRCIGCPVLFKSRPADVRSDNAKSRTEAERPYLLDFMCVSLLGAKSLFSETICKRPGYSRNPILIISYEIMFVEVKAELRPK